MVVLQYLYLDALTSYKLILRDTDFHMLNIT